MVRSHQDPEAFVSMVRLGNLCAGGHSHWRETGHRDRGEARSSQGEASRREYNPPFHKAGGCARLTQFRRVCGSPKDSALVSFPLRDREWAALCDAIAARNYNQSMAQARAGPSETRNGHVRAFKM